MKQKYNVVLYVVIFSLVYYLADAVVFYLISADDQSFLNVLVTDVTVYQLFVRLLAFAGFALLGFLLTDKINSLYFENETLKLHSGKLLSGKFDTNFLSSLSYQIRIPLTAITGFAQLLKDPGLSPETRELYIRHINSSSNFLLLLINNLSDISKIEADELEIERKECEINKILDEIFDKFELRKVESGKSDLPFILKKGLENEEIKILTDPDRFRQVLTNLLENALKFTNEGSVEFGYTVKDNSFLEFYVMDSGHGFSVERMEVIFNRYNKLSDNENLPFNGFILRLAISKSLVKLLGGEIRAESTPENNTLIYFTLPYLEAAETTKVPLKKDDRKGDSQDWSDRHILIAEDVESNFIYLQEILKPTKINIIWAKNGKEALDVVRKNQKICLVLMDILMPEMDGYEATREIKKIRKDLPVIAQTAFLYEMAEGDHVQFDEYLTKPIWSPQLISAVGRYIYS